MKNWPKLRVKSVAMLSKKRKVSRGTIKLVILHKHSATTVLDMQNVHLLQNLSYDEFKNLTNMGEWELHKHSAALEHRPTKKKESIIILFDTGIGL